MKIGILGLGIIAHTMADTLIQMDDVECWAVGCRDIERAKTFSEKYGFKKAYGSYEELVSDPDVELIYVATPHSHHYEHVRLCLENGKHVLCEKAFTVNAQQAEKLIALSRERGLLLTEAIWTRFAPIRAELEALTKNSPIGKMYMLSGNLGYPVMHADRSTNPLLAGGALLDLGVYAINFALMAFGTDISSVSSAMVPTASGVDMQNTISFSYSDGRMATLYSTMATRTNGRGIIMGTEGYIECNNLNNVQEICVYRYDSERRPQEIQKISAPKEITGYEYEVRAAMRAVLEGKVECEEMPHAEILRVMQIMDDLRRTWGIVYPGENDL